MVTAPHDRRPGFGSFGPVPSLRGGESRKNHHKQSGATKVLGGGGSFAMIDRGRQILAGRIECRSHARLRFRGQQMENGGRIEPSAPESILQAVDQTDAPKRNFFLRSDGPTNGT